MPLNGIYKHKGVSKKMETKIYAAYGSNMNLKQMKKRCPKAEVIGKGELLGYKLTFRGKQTRVANVEQSKNDSVHIVLWAITKECEKALDRYEGYPRLHKKEVVTIAMADGDEEAMLYVMAKEYEKCRPCLPTFILKSSGKDIWITESIQSH